MIIKSRVNGQWALSVFENFWMDRNLPKHASNRPKSNINSKQPDSIQFDDSMSENSPFIPTTPSVWSSNSGVKISSEYHYDLRHRFIDALSRLLRINKRENEKASGNIDPLRILLSVRGSLKEAQDYTDRVNTYDAVIQQAKTAGQKARMEHLLKARQTVMFESLLISAGFKKFLSEAQVIEFARKCQKGLRLDWIANFTRPIPDAVVTKKTEADTLKVFDNYVVLHYDPNTKAFALTEAQALAKKDPILFGIIDGVRKLYFIGDWKDDECSLTMDEVATVLGNPTSEIDVDPTKE